jgi:hypothetical protein
MDFPLAFARRDEYFHHITILDTVYRRIPYGFVTERLFLSTIERGHNEMQHIALHGRNHCDAHECSGTGTDDV